MKPVFEKNCSDEQDYFLSFVNCYFLICQKPAQKTNRIVFINVAIDKKNYSMFYKF